MKVAFALAVAAAGLAVAAVLAAQPAGALTPVCGNINVDTVWTLAESPYHVTCNVTVVGTDGVDGVTTLTIEPGVEVQFAFNTALNVATCCTTGALDARGFPGQPIVFTSDQLPGTKTPGHWSRLYIDAASNDALTVLEHVTVEYGGRTTAGVYVNNARPTIRDTTVQWSGLNTGYYGIYVASDRPALERVTLLNNLGRPLRMLVDTPIADIVADGNGINKVLVAGGTLSVDTTWPRVRNLPGTTVPYEISGTVTIAGTDGPDGVTTLTIEPGTELWFNSALAMNVGTCCTTGALRAVGTELQPIVFTSNQDGARSAGFWGRLYIDAASSDAATTLEHVTVEYGGRSTAGIYINNARPTIRNVVVQHNGLNTGYYGLYVASDRPTLESVTARNNLGRPLRILPDTVLAGVTAHDNGIQTVEIAAATLGVDHTWTRVVDDTGATVPYEVTGTMSILGTNGPDGVTTLTVDAGVELRFRGGAILNVGSCCTTGALIARGTPLEPVVFTSAQDPGSKTRGSWARVEFQNAANDAVSAVEHAVFEYGGSGSAGVLRFNTAAPSIVRDIRVTNSTPYGLRVDNSPVTVERLVASDNGATSGTGGYGVYVVSGPSRASFIDATITGTTFGRPMRVLPDTLLSSIVVDGNAIEEVERAGGTLALDTTWPRVTDLAGATVPYFVSGSIFVRGTDGADGVTSLTIDPGVEMRFGPGVELEVGYCCNAALRGALDARGTVAQPIVFTSNRAAKTRGHWGPLEFANHADDALSFLENATVEDGGYVTAGLYVADSSPTIRHVTLRSNQYRGAYVSNSLGVFEDVAVSDTAWSAGGNGNGFEVVAGSILLDGLAATNNVGWPARVTPETQLIGAVADGNTLERVAMTGATMARDTTWRRVTDLAGNTVPYEMTGWVYVRGTDGPDGVTTLTIEPGVEMRFNQGQGLEVAYCCSTALKGALDARGTVDEPIVFTSNRDTKSRGFWGPLRFSQYTVDGATFLENAVIEDGGYTTAGMEVSDADPTVRAVTFRSNQYRGLYAANSFATFEDIAVSDTAWSAGGNGYGIEVASGAPRLDGVTAIANVGWPLRVIPDTRLTGIFADGNTVQRVLVAGGTMTVDVTWPRVADSTGAAVPYEISGWVYVRGSDGLDGVTTLTIEPGAELWFNQGQGLEVSYCCSAALKGAFDARGTAAEPILFTSNRATKTGGFWGPLRFAQYTEDGASFLENAIVEDGGYTTAAVHFAQGAPTFRENTVRVAATGLYVNGPGIRIEASDIEGATYPARLADADGAVVRGNRFTTATGFTWVEGSTSGALLYDNVFDTSGGGIPVRDDGTSNTWSVAKTAGPNVIGGAFIGGNLYSDYTGFDYSNPSDGIGDSDVPYVILTTGGVARAEDPLPLAPPTRWDPDLDPPITFADLIGTLGENGWYRSNVDVVLTATDDKSGVARIHHSLDGGPFFSTPGATATVVVGTDGPHTMDFRAEDNGGNIEETQRVAVKIDGTPPDVTVVVDQGEVDDLCFTILAADAASGISTVSYSVLDAAGDPVTNRTGATLSGVATTEGERVCADLAEDGRFRARAEVTDVAGNLAEALTDLFIFDVEPPVVTLVRPIAGETYVGSSRVDAPPVAPPDDAAVVIVETEVVAEAFDTGTGVARGEFLVDGVLVATDDHAPFRWWFGTEHAAGDHMLTVRAYDEHGRFAEVHQLVRLITDPLERLASFAPSPMADAGCRAAGAYVRLAHGTLFDADLNRVIALSRANITAGLFHEEERFVEERVGRVLALEGVASRCDATTTPAHAACGEANATAFRIDLRPLGLPIQLAGEALSQTGCSDPASATGSAVTHAVEGTVFGNSFAAPGAADENTVLPLVGDPAGIGTPVVVAYLILNVQSVAPVEHCLFQDGAAMRLIALDPLTAFTSVAADVSVGWVSTIACRMPVVLDGLSSPVGPGVQPGVPAIDVITVRGEPGQRIPAGDVAFHLCGPAVATGAGCADGDGVAIGGPAALDATGTAVSEAAVDTWEVGRHCWRADYAGDAYFLPGNHTDGADQCFVTGRQPPGVALSSEPSAPDMVPGTPVTATALFTGYDGAPSPTGTAAFFLCAPADVSPQGCVEPSGVPAGTASLGPGGAATSAIATDTWVIGTYCWRVEYSGDGFYLSATHTTAAPVGDACFTAVRQPVTITLVASLAGLVHPGSDASASATVEGVPAVPPPEGEVTFHLCRPREVSAEGCGAGGLAVPPATAIVAGTAVAPVTNETRHIGVHCWRAEYGGDALYLPASHTDPTLSCFRTYNPCAKAGDAFGSATAAADGLLVAGAPDHDVAGFADAGAVCVFDGETGEWVATYENPAPQTGDHFGAAVGIGNGVVAVGAPDDDARGDGAGAAYAIPLATGVATELGPVSGAAGDAFGASVAVFDGVIVVGVPGADVDALDAGRAHLFTSAGAFLHAIPNPAPGAGDRFGAAVAGVDGYALIGAPNDDTWASDAGAAYVFNVSDAFLIRTLLAPEPAAGDRFGAAVAGSGAFAIVGAPGDDRAGPDAGAVHLIEAASGLVARTLLDPAPAADDGFGLSVAPLLDDVLVGAPHDDADGTDAGAAYLFDGATGLLLHTFHGPLPSPAARFGTAVAASGDNALVGAPGADPVVVGKWADAGIAALFDDTTAPPLFTGPFDGPPKAAAGALGSAVASFGDDILVGAPDDGAGHVRLLDGATGAHVALFPNPAPAPGDRFGAALTVVGSDLVVGAPNDDARAKDAGRVYRIDVASGGVTYHMDSPVPGIDDQFGAALAADGTRILVGAPGDDTGAPVAGAAYLFDAATGAFVRTFANPTPAFNDRFGEAVAIIGGTIVVGAPGDDGGALDGGVVHAFDAATGALLWTAASPSPAVGDGFGATIAGFGTLVAVGAPYADAGAPNTGSAFLFDVGTGGPIATFARPTTGLDDLFGASIAVAGERFLIGAPGDDAGAPGAGAVYVMDDAGGHIQTLLNPSPAPGDAFGAAVGARDDDVIVGAPGDDAAATNAGAFHVFDGATGMPGETI